MDIGNLTEGIIADLSEHKSEEPKDYEKGEFLYCGKCDQPKARIKRNSQGKRLYLDIGMACGCNKGVAVKAKPKEVKFDKEAWDAKEKADQERYEREHKEAIEKRRGRAFSDSRLKQWTFENDDNANPYITSVAKKYVEHYATMWQRGKGLLLYGGVGTGKSYIAACIVNALVEDGHSCKFTNFSRLSNELMACEFNERQNFINGLNTYDLLVIDDFGAERGTEFMNEVVFSIIDARQTSGKPMVVTTNLTGENLKHPADLTAERIYSRLFEMCIPIEVKGTDRRKLKLRDENADLKELLGIADGKDK